MDWDAESSCVQEELSKRFSSAFEDVDQLELHTFLAVMRMLKMELLDRNTGVYKTLLAILSDYDPTQLSSLEKTKKYINLLLEKSFFPELADYLISALPTFQPGEPASKFRSLSLLPRPKLQEDEIKGEEPQNCPGSGEHFKTATSSVQEETPVAEMKNLDSEIREKDQYTSQGIDVARFESKEYLEQIEKPVAPPDYTNPWGMTKLTKGKNRKRNSTNVKGKANN